MTTSDLFTGIQKNWVNSPPFHYKYERADLFFFSVLISEFSMNEFLIDLGG